VAGGGVFRRFSVSLAALAAAWCAEPVLRIPPVSTTVNIEGQPVQLSVSGSVFTAAADDGRETIRVELNADLADFQRNLTAILGAQLNQSNRCGERLTVLNAKLLPVAPAAALTLTAHVEKWVCAKAFGKEIVKRLVGGDGTIGVHLTPRVEDGAVKLAAEVTTIEADGSLGELLRSDAIREKIRATVVSAVEKSTDFKAALPPAVQKIVSIERAQFAATGDGRLALAVSSQVRIPAAQARELIEHLKR